MRKWKWIQSLAGTSARATKIACLLRTVYALLPAIVAGSDCLKIIHKYAALGSRNAKIVR